MLQNNRKKWKENKNRGAAMVIVLCVMAAFLALSVSVLLGASTAMNTAGQSVIAEQCRIQTVTFCDLIDEAMKADNTGSMQSYLREEMQSGSWARYEGEENRDEAVRSFVIEHTVNSMDMELYWTDENSEDLSGARLHVKLTTTKGDVKFCVESVYELECEDDGESVQEYDGESVWNWTLVERK